MRAASHGEWHDSSASRPVLSIGSATFKIPNPLAPAHDVLYALRPGPEFGTVKQSIKASIKDWKAELAERKRMGLA